MRPLSLLPTLLAAPLLAVPQDAPRTSTEGRLEPVTHLHDRLRQVQPLEQVAAPPSADFLTVNDDPEGDMPREIAYSADGTEVVVVNRDTDLVSFIDVATRDLTDTVPVGDFPVHVAVAPDNSVAVVPNVLDDTVSLIDMSTHAVTTVPVTGSQPYRVAVTTDSQFAVVGVINDATNSSVSVIDLGSASEVLSFGTTPQGVFGGFFTPESGIFGNIFTSFALSPDDKTLLLPDRFGDTLALYDITNGSQIALLATDPQPTSVDVSADGTFAVLADDGSGASIETVDLTVPAITNSFVTGSQTFVPQVRMTPSKSHAILSVLNNVEFIDLSSGAVTSTVSTGSVGDIEISFDGQYATVSNFNFRIIDIASQSLVKTLPFAACAEAAASPVDHRVVALNNRFREDVQFYATDGTNGAFEGVRPSGVEPEGDAPRTLALTPDGKRALVANNISNQAAIVDLEAKVVDAYPAAGGRQLGVAVTPDGTTGIIANGNDDTVSILDLGTGTEVATLFVPSTPTEVEVAPDGSEAYVTSVAGLDRLWFIDLNGASSTVTGSLTTGQLGVISYTYGVFSGLTLSPDGRTLAVCVSFDDELLLVDTATQSEITRIPVGDFPIQAAFSSDSSTVYVTHSFGDNLFQITDSGGGNWSITGTTGNLEFPLQVTVGPADEFVYVGSFDFTDPHVRAVRASTMKKVAKVSLGSRPRTHATSADALFVTLTDGDVARLRMAGSATALVETASLTGSPSDMVFSPALGMAVACQPGADDGLDLVRFGGDPMNYCGPAVRNSSGLPAKIAATGTFLAGGHPLELAATDLPANQFGYFLASQTQGFTMPPGSQGNLCLAGTIHRFNKQVQNSGPAGAFSIEVDTQDLPLGGAIQPGETWNFQGWFRDKNPAATSNFTDGVSVTFE